MVLAAAAILFASAFVAPSMLTHTVPVSPLSADDSSAAPMHSTMSIHAVLPSTQRGARPSSAPLPLTALLGLSLLAVHVNRPSIALLSMGSLQLLPRERRALLRVYLN
jgi:hypothetical protein